MVRRFGMAVFDCDEECFSLREASGGGAVTGKARDGREQVRGLCALDGDPQAS